MTSWRDSASPAAQQDLEGLIEPALGFAQQQLAKYGEFFPYAVVVRADGQTEMIHARPDADDERPASADVIDACRTTLAERRDQLRAAAVVELEHAEGPALTILLPYSKKWFGRGIDYGTLQAAAGTRHVWPD